MQLNFNELRELIAALNQTDIAELTLKSADFELTLRKGDRYPLSGIPPEVSHAVPSAALNATLPPPVAPSEPAAPPTPVADKRWVEITSPLVGTFYRSPAPDEPPFVDVGDRIRTGQTVCIIEAMKVMNELEAEVSGQIVEVLVENGQPVEFGQTLMRVNPE
ncbi:MAG: acetyl-CoA carboxylase biotin carboxyl carrier protein [Desertifilum sp.]|nr:acetyl-CoA carboxylase biotin carboxyl carrier protein [Desertifilum sp.]MDL5052108.1 acetyl-CoA carboxylase biotin carboxyl carrier protein [Oscillatoria laete-virens NRMC-F 0139]